MEAFKEKESQVRQESAAMIHPPSFRTCRCHPLQLWTCCNAPLWFRHWMSVIVIFCAVLMAFLVIAASLMSQSYRVDVPAIGFEYGAYLNQNLSVIVVGAGASGLFAGYTLKYLGIENVQIIEAKQQFGGRTVAMNGFVRNVPLDLGAEWIHVHPDILEQLLLLPEDEDPAATLPPLPTTIRYRPQTISVKTGSQKLSSRNWMRYFYADTKFHNSTWWSYLNDFVVVPNLIDKIRLNTAVELIDYNDPNQIRVVTTTGQEYFADRVIVATPVNILRDEIVTFKPAVSQRKVEAWNAVHVADGLKVWLEFSERFFHDLMIPGGSAISTYFQEDRLYFDALYGKKDLTDQLVFALFEVGTTARTKVKLTDDELVQLLLNELDSLYQGQASRFFVQSHVQNWSREPYIQGAYSYNW